MTDRELMEWLAKDMQENPWILEFILGVRKEMPNKDSELVLKIIDEFHSRANPKSENYRTMGQRIQNLIEQDRKETTQQAAQRALDWYDSPALYYGPDQEKTARETLYKSVLGEEW